jgi:hypothetical protein
MMSRKATLSLRGKGMMSCDPQLIKNAKLVSRYASETGKPVPELNNAIKLAEAAPNNGKTDAEAEQDLLAAQASVINHLGVTDITAIQTWYSSSEQMWGFFTRALTFLCLFLSLIAVISFTFPFNDAKARLEEITSFCREKALSNKNHEQSLVVDPTTGIRISAAEKPSIKDCFLLESRATDNVVESTSTVEISTNYARISVLNQDIAERVKLYSNPPSILLFTRNIADKFGIKILVSDESERVAQLQAFPGAVLYNAANDLSFIVYLFGSGILPMFYGLLGSSVFLLRRSLSTSPDDYRMVTSVVTTVMRLGLGCVAGIIVGWLAGPSELSSIKDLANGPFVLAFIAGFSIDIVFSVMDRIILAFDPLRK